MGHLELTVFHFLIIDCTTTNVSKIFITPSAERAVVYLCNLVIGTGRKQKYREWNGRSNRYVIHLTCSRQSLKWNVIVFDVLKYFDFTKSEFFFDILYYACFVMRGLVRPHYKTHKLEECLPSFN
jgi:hypothetical protein